jgi:hypothetical protein
MIAQLDTRPECSTLHLDQRLRRLAWRATPDAAQAYLRSAFADEAESVLGALGDQVWCSRATGPDALRAAQLLDSCWDRLADLRTTQLPASAIGLHYCAQRLCQDATAIYHLLNPGKHA